ncbi:MAG TPA: homoserine dehydrogenase [Deltaproteobacteria bacterium]|nr:homoserine dehydrogenase [Deltaproteobacteria bacterium]
MDIGIGLIGFGTVGTGVVRILQNNADLIEGRLGRRLVLRKIADLDIKRDRGVPIQRDMLTTDAYEVIDDPTVDIVVELIGGIEPAKSFILRALELGKPVVTANKALLAQHGAEIFGKAAEKGIPLGFEASVGGGIPVLKALREGLVANNIEAILGILNGTSNYILTRMTEEGLDFKRALSQAQRLGYAEADPSLDVDGVDAAHKLTILASFAFGTWIDFKRVYVEGIRDISPLDIEFSREFGYRIKLLAIAKRDGGKIELRVHPTMIPEGHLLSQVQGVYNAIYIVGDSVGPTLFYGQGAGSAPTGSAVVSDLVDIVRRGRLLQLPSFAKDRPLKDIEDLRCPYYLRFTAVDRPGVLSKISGILGENDISIASVIQKGRTKRGAVPIVMMTHEAVERNIRRAIEEIDALDVIKDSTKLIRVEALGV